MASTSITFSVKVAFWVRWYIAGVSMFAWVTGMQPDMDQVSKTVSKGIRLVLQ